MKKSFTYILFLSAFFNLIGRSPFRAPEPLRPSITFKWEHDPKKYTLQSSYLQEYPYFQLFPRVSPLLKKHYLPTTAIHFRSHPNQKVNGSLLITLINEIITLIKASTCRSSLKNNKHFCLVTDKDFNWRKQSGLVMVCFKNYPFIVKIFIEKPSSLVRPLDKGFESRFFFYLAGGMTRHLSGFTRIKNLEIIREKIENNPYWSEKINLHRKWFWMPTKDNWITLEGKNIGNNKKIKGRIPGTYCIIVDAIDIEREFSIVHRDDRKIALQLCNYLEQHIDAHIDNFAIDANTKKIAILDTEYFPSLVGLSKPRELLSYTGWYTDLIGRAGQRLFFRTKWQRHQDQIAPASAMYLTE